MAVSKRLRYEILRRDNHTCRYCGAAAPGVPLTVDHVVPATLGGSDESSNLVTACRDCNSGKAASSPDSPIVAEVDARALLWSTAMQIAADERAAAFAHQVEVNSQFIAKWNAWHWTDWRGDEHHVTIPGNWHVSVQQFLAAGLTMDDLHELVDVAMNARTDDEWRYFCGCCWRRVREAQARAAAITAEFEELQRG